MKITPNEAIQRIPQLSLIGGTAKKTSNPIEFVRSVGYADDAVYLLRQGAEGYIVPSESDLHPILGEATDADFTLDLPLPMSQWLQGYAEEIEWYQAIGHAIPVADDVPDAAESKDVAAMVKTMWAQEYPFNYNLKMSDGKRSIVGCGNVAMGMILYYWATKGYLRGCTATKDYTTTTNKYEVAGLPPKSVFDFANMTLKKPTETANIKAIAELLEYCGKATKSDFKPTSTGTYETDMVTALRNYFRLADVSLVYAGKLGLSAFCKRIRQDLANGCPVIVDGFNAKLTGGHSFVCDGYRSSDDKYHFNWGWFGRCNGWYRMNALTPTSTRNYSYRKNAIVGIQPTYKRGDVNADGKINVTDIVSAVEKKLKGEYDERADINYDGKIDNDDLEEGINIILGK